REGVPRTILEALAMGKPVITTDNTGCRETVQPGVNGFLIAKKQLEPLVNAMKALLEDPEKIEMMGKASVRLAKEKFDVSAVNNAMLKFMNIR
ncbi:MAG TPA: glycosyltransferase, partial [Cyclobacteriaceae bacterium]|nr:glycosyltransferase [Cyclobacteriaceae bacterium]